MGDEKAGAAASSGSQEQQPSSATSAPAVPQKRPDEVNIAYMQYRDEGDLAMVMRLIDNELSEPYSIFTYRYFLVNWPHLTFLCLDGDHCFGVIVAKCEPHRSGRLRGYIAMLVVEPPYRSLGVGSQLVRRVINEMAGDGCQEVSLEAEVCNAGALRLYGRLGFLRDKRLKRYYLNGSDAFRLKLLLKTDEDVAAEAAAAAEQHAAGEEGAGEEELAAAEQLRHLHVLDQQQLQPHGDIS